MFLLWQLLIEMLCKLSPVRSKGDSDFLRIISSAFWSYHPFIVLLVLLKDLNRGRRTARNLPCSLDIRRSICWLSTLIFANLPRWCWTLLFFLGWYQFVCFFFLSRSLSLCFFVPYFVVLVFIVILSEACRFVYLPFWLKCWLRILQYVYTL